MHKLIATGFGIGYIGKGGGSLAAFVVAVIWYLAGSIPPGIAFGMALFLTMLGVWSASAVEKYWGVDSSKVVIDEIAGMCISLLFIPVTASYVVAAFFLFRFFDIVKPLLIRKLEKLPAGWGVMMDDVLAGIYANLILQVVKFFS